MVIQMHPARAYLLGSLSPEDAATVEDRYFCDPAYFAGMKTAEQRLIREYLEDRLPAEERELFVRRYLQTPHLKELVDAARTRNVPQSAWFSWRPALAAALVVCAIGLGLLYRPAVDSRGDAGGIPLSPGLVKSATGAVNLPLPKTPGPVRLLLELPGESTPVECTVRLSEVPAAGSWQRIDLPGERLRSTPMAGGQRLTVTLASSLLHEGDFVLEVLTLDGPILQTYVFHVR